MRRIMNYEIIQKEEPQIRDCLNCEEEFTSESKYNRICKECKKEAEMIYEDNEFN